MEDGRVVEEEGMEDEVDEEDSKKTKQFQNPEN